MISYELAKQLKEAGFPQDNMGPFIRPDGSRFFNGNPDKHPSVPGLTKLIEACGDHLFSIERDGSLTFWYAVGKDYTEEGKTPEISVAELVVSIAGKQKSRLKTLQDLSIC
jgi:hypothetical protein